MKPATNIEEMILELQKERNRFNKDVDDAIASLRKLGASNPVAGASVAESGMSAYEIAVEALEKHGKPVTVTELAKLVLATGFKSKGGDPVAIVSSSIHKAIATRKRCELVKQKDGRVGLRGWKG